MARSDGRDLVPHKRRQLLERQDEFREEYPHSVPPGTLLLRCRTCQQVYPLNCFTRNSQRRYGVLADCRWCRSRKRCQEDRHEPAEVRDKWCPGCQARLPIDAFYTNRKQPDGYSHDCRACAKRRKVALTDARHHDQVQVIRREQTIRLCAELGIDVPDHDLKQCSRCHQVKPLEEFVNDWCRADRKKSVCLECHR